MGRRNVRVIALC